jgi:hypothetical protein
MRTMVDLEKIIWRTSKTFVFGNGYNIVLAMKPADTAAGGRHDDLILAAFAPEANDIPSADCC